jgi:DHA1 family purine base/nucleoside efflux pump-like MFS transporter
VVSLGVTGSVTAGVPAGTWIGGAFGWLSTFLVMAATGVLAALALLRTLPDRAIRITPPPLRRQLQVLASSPIALGLAANTLLIGGSMMLLTYLAPFVAGIAQADTGVRGLLFAVSGVAGTVGIWTGGLATDRWGADRAIAVGAGAVLAVMACFALLWPSRPVSIVLVGALTRVWGGAAFWCSPGVQARLHELAGALAPQALALNTAATHFGVALGGAVGGTLLTSSGPEMLPVASGLLVLAALVVLLLADGPAPAPSRDRPHDRRGTGPDRATP